jgi:hypothetical protein
MNAFIHELLLILLFMQINILLGLHKGHYGFSDPLTVHICRQNYEYIMLSQFLLHSGKSSWLQIQRCGFDSLHYQIF